MLWTRIVLGFIVFAQLWACTPTDNPQEKLNQAQVIVDRAIAAHGGERYANSSYNFDFRGKSYSWTTSEGQFAYTRSFEDSSGLIVDHLSNEGFFRTLDGERSHTTHEQDSMYSNSVNSVLYFIRLPYGLNDLAVNKKYLGEESINGKNYHKVEVTFEQEGGGKDYDDVFIYWFETQNYTLDYLAYSYETDGGGLRFRKAYNPSTLEGIRFQDYVNYKAALKPGRKVHELGKLFESAQLDSLSSIISENISLR